MDPLKLVAQALSLELETPLEGILGAIKGLIKKADDGAVWEREAHDNLNKMEQTETLLRENAALKADIFMKDAVANFQIDKAEAEVLKEMYLSGEEGQKAVTKLLATRSRRDYFAKKSSLTGKEIPTDPAAELSGRVAEAKAKNPKLTDVEAVNQVYKADPALFKRVTEARRKAGTKEGVS